MRRTFVTSIFLLFSGYVMGTSASCGGSVGGGGGAAGGGGGGGVAGGSGGSAASGGSGGGRGIGGVPPPCTDPACCPVPPDAGVSCPKVYEGHSCQTQELCDGGLFFQDEVVCTGGTWTSSGFCGTDGGPASNGCPDAQPVNGTTCALSSKVSCVYSINCGGCEGGSSTASDAGSAEGGGTTGTGCASEMVSGLAICNGGLWQVEPAICGGD